MSSNRIRVLVLGLGANGLGVSRALRAFSQLDVWAANFNKKDAGRFTRSAKILNWQDPANEPDEFKDRLFNLSKNGTRTILFPTRDVEVDLLAELSDSLPENLLYYRNSIATVKALADKNLVAETATQAGLDIPRTVIMSEKINPKLAGFRYPVLIKPLKQGSSQTPFKNIFVNSDEEFQKIFEDHDHLLNQTVIQEFIPGGDDHIYHCNILVDKNAKTIGVVEFQKIRQYLPLRGMTSYGQTILTRNMVPSCERLAKQAGYGGLMNVEFKKDTENKRWVFIEVNLRLPIFNSVFPETGVNLAYLYVKSLTEKLNPPVFADRTAKWMYEENDLANILTHKTPTSWRTWFRQFIKTNAFAYWNTKDPLPGLIAFWRIFVIGLKRIFPIARLF